MKTFYLKNQLTNNRVAMWLNTFDSDLSQANLVKQIKAAKSVTLAISEEETAMAIDAFKRFVDLFDFISADKVADEYAKFPSFILRDADGAGIGYIRINLGQWFSNETYAIKDGKAAEAAAIVQEVLLAPNPTWFLAKKKAK